MGALLAVTIVAVVSHTGLKTATVPNPEQAASLTATRGAENPERVPLAMPATATAPDLEKNSTRADFVSPADIGRGVGPIEPVVVGGGDVVVSVAGEVLENRLVEGCLVVDADNVTVRNVVVRCGGFRAVTVNAVSGASIENVTVDCLGGPAKGVYLQGAVNFSIDRVEITGCDDQFFIDGGVGVSSITNSVFHNQSPGVGSHTDGMQIGEFETTTGTLTVASNWWQYDRQGCCANAVLFATNRSALTVNVRRNYLDGDFGVHVLRCVPGSVCNIEYNTLNGNPTGLFFQSTGNAGTARCNRYVTGEMIPDRLYGGITVDNTGC